MNTVIGEERFKLRCTDMMCTDVFTSEADRSNERESPQLTCVLKDTEAAATRNRHQEENHSKSVMAIGGEQQRNQAIVNIILNVNISKSNNIKKFWVVILNSQNHIS